ncbi:MAG: EVE domain-containing protein [Rhodobacteraceae bacterium]|nr:EVE domain-containing protein [Paracoccaceae bacterium]MCF8516282.1 EVE domain-containing protein [Paracoccaceae bacterium]MCF8520632.1 EVE domain-containing protein [Paracoccaceae bacterium]
MNHWLFKSEPDAWSWDQQVANGVKGEEWTGVRNYQARNNMRAMKVGDLGFFYHSNIGKEIVGIVEVIRESAPDSSTDDARWDCVVIKAVRPVKKTVTLDACKVEPGLAAMALVTNTRLSVQPVTAEEWRIVCNMAGIDPI